MSREKRLIQRLTREFSDAAKSKIFNIAYCDDDIYNCYFIFTVTNEDSVYYGQEHIVSVDLSHKNGTLRYPTIPPQCQFVTNVWHSNVSVDGHICLDTLKSQWSPMFWFETIVQTIILLLDEPNPDSALNNTAAQLQRRMPETRAQFSEKVTSFYATGISENGDKINNIKKMIR